MSELDKECQQIISKMTNWQNMQWSRAGRPGGTEKLCPDRCNPEILKTFLNMRRSDAVH